MGKRARPYVHKTPHQSSAKAKEQQEIAASNKKNSQPEAKDSLSIASLLLRWQQLTPVQKVISLLVVLTASGMALAMAYQCAPLFTHFLNKATQPNTQGGRHQLPSFKQGMFSGFSQENLLAKIERVSIEPDPKFLHMLEQFGTLSSKEQTLQNIAKQTKMTRDALSTAMHPKVLDKILDDDNFSIKITSELLINAKGNCDTVTKTVYIAYDYALNEVYNKQVLKNELHSMAVYVSNFAKQTNKINVPDDAFLLASPTLKDNWQQDEYLSRKLTNIVRDIEAKCEHLIKLSKKILSGQSLTVQEDNEYEHYKNALKSYQPKTFEFEFNDYTPQQRQQFLKNLKLSSLPGVKYTIPLHLLSPNLTKPPYYIDPTVYVIDLQEKSTFINQYQIKLVYTYFNSKDPSKDNLVAFIGDYFDYVWRYQDYAYPEGHTAISEETMFSLEKSSDFEELRPNFPLEFYQEWCNYFSEYHQVDDYCEVGNQMNPS